VEEKKMIADKKKKERTKEEGKKGENSFEISD
jgi:hypothetical protein